MIKDTREHILVTSLKLFLKKRFKEVTMRDIVNATELSKGAFYHYFESKEAVFEEVVKYFYNKVMITDYSSFPLTSLKDFYMAYLDRLQNSPDDIDDEDSDTNLFVFVAEAARKIPTFQHIHSSQRIKEIDAWSGAVARAKASKEISSNLSNEDIAQMFINLSDGIALNRSITQPSNADSLKSMQKCWDGLYQLLATAKV